MSNPEDICATEDEAPTPPLPPFFLSPRIRPPHTRAAMRQMRATAPSTYHSLLPSRTPPLLPIPLPAPSTSRRADIPEADTPPRKRLLLTTPRPGSSDEELEELMKDQPLSADASPTALSPGYIADSNPEEDKEDPEEDPADHPADG
ncbi:hypothetical protein Tco_1327623 [Tanacetum coccineum]